MPKATGPWLHSPEIERVERGAAVGGWQPWVLHTRRGDVDCRFAEAPNAHRAVLCVGGAGGGFDTPACGLYVRLGESLPREGCALLRVKFRQSTRLEEAVHDALAGAHVLASQGIERIGLVGHSLGGAVVIIAATEIPEVTTVVTLATQSYGGEAAEYLGDRSLLAIHGTDDEILPPECSRYVYELVRGERRLVLIDGARHVLDESADEVFDLVREWLLAHTAPRQPEARP